MEEKKYIQIGQIAARDPSGNFLPAVPVFAEATPEAEAREERLFGDIGRIFARKMKSYIDAGKQISKSSP